MSMFWSQSKIFTVRFILVVLTITFGFFCTLGLRGFRPDDRALAEGALRRLWSGDQDGALAMFQEAVRANPASPYRWADLAEGLLDAGQQERGERAIERAAGLGPNLPQILLRAANFEFRTGADRAAAAYSARVLALTRAEDAAIFSSYNRFGISIETILADGLPQDRAAILAYFDSVLAAGAADDAAVVWAWMRQKSVTNEQIAAEYVFFLMARDRSQDAANVWKEQLATVEPGYRSSNFLSNADFLRAPSGSPLDWRITEVPGVQVTREACDRG